MSKEFVSDDKSLDNDMALFLFGDKNTYFLSKDIGLTYTLDDENIVHGNGEVKLRMREYTHFKGKIKNMLMFNYNWIVLTTDGRLYSHNPTFKDPVKVKVFNKDAQIMNVKFKKILAINSTTIAAIDTDGDFHVGKVLWKSIYFFHSSFGIMNVLDMQVWVDYTWGGRTPDLVVLFKSGFLGLYRVEDNTVKNIQGLNDIMGFGIISSRHLKVIKDDGDGKRSYVHYDRGFDSIDFEEIIKEERIIQISNHAYILPDSGILFDTETDTRLTVDWLKGLKLVEKNGLIFTKIGGYVHIIVTKYHDRDLLEKYGIVVEKLGDDNPIMMIRFPIKLD